MLRIHMIERERGTKWKENTLGVAKTNFHACWILLLFLLSHTYCTDRDSKSVSCLSVCHQAQMEFCNTNIWPGWLHQRYLYKSLQRSCMHFLHGFLWQWIESLLHAVAQKQQIILTVVFSVSTHSTDVIHNSTVLGKVAHRITLLRPIQRFIYTCYLRGTKTPSPLENTTPNRIRLVVWNSRPIC